MMTVINEIGSRRLVPSIRTHIEHVNHVTEHVRKKQEDTSCPKCGSEMVLRVVKRVSTLGNVFGVVLSFLLVGEHGMSVRPVADFHLINNCVR